MSQHTSKTALIDVIKNVNIKPSEIYYHYRTPSQYYKVLIIALSEANKKPMIVY